MSRHDSREDFYESQEAHDMDFAFIWECDRCHHRREDPPGYNEGGACTCGGEFHKVGEAHN